MTFLTFPYCENLIEKGLRSEISVFRNKLQEVTFTNVDGILEIGNQIKAIFEEKHSKCHRIPVYQLITMKRIAQALDCPLYVVFSKDEFAVYEIELHREFSGRYYYPSDDELILLGELRDFQRWIYHEFLRSG